MFVLVLRENIQLRGQGSIGQCSSAMVILEQESDCYCQSVCEDLGGCVEWSQ